MRVTILIVSIIVIMVAVVVGFLVIVSRQRQSPSTTSSLPSPGVNANSLKDGSHWLVYRDAERKYVLKYPKNWVVSQLGKAVSFKYLDFARPVADFAIIPDSDPIYGFGEESGLTLIEKKRISVNAQVDATEEIGIYKDKNQGRLSQITFEKDGQTWTITHWIYRSQDISAYLPTLELMLSSFRFLE